jgi:hypothetical protein
MANHFLTRVETIAAGLLKGEKVHVDAKGEDYYAFSLVNDQGVASTIPPVWIDPRASDDEIRKKLGHEFQLAFNPDAEPGDLSVPNLRTEAKRPDRRRLFGPPAQ